MTQRPSGRSSLIIFLSLAPLIPGAAGLTLLSGAGEQEWWGMFLIALAVLWMIKPLHLAAAFAVAVLPLRDRSPELPDILEPALRQLKGELILAGRDPARPLALEIFFAPSNDILHRPVIIAGDLTHAEKMRAETLFETALTRGLSRLARARIAARAFAATMALPEPELSNHELLEIRAGLPRS